MPTTRLCALLRQLDTRRRIREWMYAQRVSTIRRQLDEQRGTHA